MSEAKADGWNEWSRHVLHQLEELNAENIRAHQKIEEMRIELAVLKIKSGFWGALAGILTTAIILAVEYIKRRGGP